MNSALERQIGRLSSSPPPRILQVVPLFATSAGGVVTSVAGLSNALMDLGAEVTVITTDAAAPPKDHANRRPVTSQDFPLRADRLDVRLSEVRYFQRWLYAPGLRGSLRDVLPHIDVAHIHGFYLYPQFAAWQEVTSAGIPYIVSTRGMLDPYLRRRNAIRKMVVNKLWLKRLVNNASAIHCTTTAERDLISDLEFSPQHVVIANGMHLEDFTTLPSPAHFRNRYLKGSEAPLVVNHGRLNFKKGLDILIEAMAQVKQYHPDTILAIVGPDNEGLGAELQIQANRLGIGSSIVFAGELQGRELFSALAAADVWALPSHSENFGHAVAEAMAAGRPVVASRAVNIAPDAQAEGALAMVDVDAESTASAIIDLLDHPEKRRAMGERGRRYVERFDWSNVGRQYLEMYESIVEQHRAKTGE